MSKDIATALNELKRLGNVDRAVKDKIYHKSKK